MKFPDKIIYRLHAVKRMFERDISEEAVAAILDRGVVIQEYLDDKPYPSYLVAGEHEKRPLHAVVSINHKDQTTIESGFILRRKK